MSEMIYTDGAFTANQEGRARRLLRICLWLVAVFSGSWAAGIYLLVHGEHMVLAVAFNVIISLLSFIALLFRQRIPFRVLAHLVLIILFIFIWFIQLKLEGLSSERTATANLWFLVLAVGAVLVLYRESRMVLIGYVALAFVSFAVCSFDILESSTLMALDQQGRMFARGITFVCSFVTLTLLTLAWDKEVRDAEGKLVSVNNRMEELLVNMLPRSISERLRREGKAFADGIAECSVMFVDIVGFTKISFGLPPSELVKLLDEIFSSFDELTTNAGLEKIKTIGDSYMVAAGIPDPRPDHAQSLVRLAMEMQAVIRRYGMHIRCGINSGNVVAGVIGRRKFIYDLWGDTVNVASRMESHGVTDEIQVTETTANLIKDEFELTRRDDVPIKGKGLMTVFLVSGVAFGARHT